MGSATEVTVCAIVDGRENAVTSRCSAVETFLTEAVALDTDSADTDTASVRQDGPESAAAKRTQSVESVRIATITESADRTSAAVPLNGWGSVVMFLGAVADEDVDMGNVCATDKTQVRTAIRVVDVNAVQGGWVLAVMSRSAVSTARPGVDHTGVAWGISVSARLVGPDRAAEDQIHVDTSVPITAADTECA
jgi:hypothetical protein